MKPTKWIKAQWKRRVQPGKRPFTDSNNIDILLVTSPPWGIHNPPLGLAYLSTYLRSQGIKTDIFDFNISLYRCIDPKWHKLWLPEFKNWWSHAERFTKINNIFKAEITLAVERILHYKPPVIGFSVVDPKERITIEIIRQVLAEDCSTRILLGGPAVSTAEQRKIFMKHIGSGLDGFVVGEGEKILVNIIQNYKHNTFTFSDHTKKNEPFIAQKAIHDLNEIPYPTYDEFDLSMYTGDTLYVEWSRGCISSCAYCKGRQLLGRYRMKKAENIVNELEYQLIRHKVSYFVVCDNLLNGNVKELERICDLLIERKLPIKWEGQGIPYRKMTSALLRKMKAAGCCKMQWGLESGSDGVLQNTRKGRIFTVNDAQEVIRCSHAAGIRNELFLIVGLPGEDDTEFSKTLAFLRANHEYIDLIKSVNTLHLIYGTEFFDSAEHYGLCLPQRDWHYLWFTKNGQNNYTVRTDRVRSIIQLAGSLGIKVQEHNLHEGQEEHNPIQ
jgi:radical SAM superfamily enzyme YgiQ (UPF0313 family)